MWRVRSFQHLARSSSQLMRRGTIRGTSLVLSSQYSSLSSSASSVFGSGASSVTLASTSPALPSLPSRRLKHRVGFSFPRIDRLTPDPYASQSTGVYDLPGAYPAVPDPPLLSVEGLPIEQQPPLLRIIRGATAEVRINQPLAMNALSADVVDNLSDIILKWGSRVKQTWSVFVTSTPSIDDEPTTEQFENSFCTGIDLLTVGERILQHKGSSAAFPGQADLDSFANLCSRLGYIRKPIAFVGDGLILGAGAAAFLSANVRLATPRSSFSITEPSMGLTPIGGMTGRLLENMPQWMAKYVALTGRRLRSSDMVRLGIATHIVPSSRLELLDVAMREMAPPTYEEALKCFYQVEDEVRGLSFAEHEDALKAVFSRDTVPQIIQALGTIHKPWANDLLSILSQRAPLALCLTNELIHRAGDLTPSECIEMEHRVASLLLRSKDFKIAAQAMLGEKRDTYPTWDISSMVPDSSFEATPGPKWASTFDSSLKKYFDQSDATLVAGLDLHDPLPDRPILNRKKVMLIKNALSRSLQYNDDGNAATIEYMLRMNVPKSKDAGYKRFAKMWKTIRDPHGLACPSFPISDQVEPEVLERGVEHPNYFHALEVQRCFQQQRDIVPYISKHDLHY